MSDKPENPPAFPSPTGNPIQDGGVTLLDYFAAKAMQGYLSNPSITGQLESETPGQEEAAKKVSEYAYVQADAMLRAREAK